MKSNPTQEKLKKLRSLGKRYKKVNDFEKYAKIKSKLLKEIKIEIE